MKKDKILTIIIIIVGVLILGESYNIIRTLNIKPNKIEKIQTNNTLSNDKSIAIWVQDNEGEEWHESDNRDTWPSPTTHGFVGAECTDSDGKEIDYTNILHFDLSTYHATIDTKNSIYCTLYFAKGEPALDHLTKKGGGTFNSTSAVDGMYRFKGTNTQVLNNYICFGTTVESTCTGTPNTYMYRIIGITSANDDLVGLKKDQIKIIKTEIISSYNCYMSKQFETSPCKTELNTTFINSILNQNNGNYWESIISNHKWYVTPHDSDVSSELKTNFSSDFKIGLMYYTDYKNSGSQDTSNWLYQKYDDFHYYELTMSVTESQYSWLIDDGGRFTMWEYYGEWIRPVFYLQSGVNLTGEGTKDHPYIITTKNNA